MKTQINKVNITAAGQSLKTIGYLMVVIILTQMIIMFLYKITPLSDLDTLKTATDIGWYVNIVCGVLIIFSLISAGSSLEDSVKYLNEGVILGYKDHVAEKQREEEINMYGGVVISTQELDKLVVSTTDLGKMRWEDAKKACAELTLNDHKDWRLPTIEELSLIHKNRSKILGFSSNAYWSNTEYDPELAWSFSFQYGNAFYPNKNNTNYVRAVRSI